MNAAAVGWWDRLNVWRVALAAFLWFAATTAWYPLLLPDEGRYVGVAWNMLDQGEPWLPLANGLPFFHKPPLFYWVTASALHVFGVNEWAARLCSVLAATAMVTLLYAFARREAGPRLAAVAAVVLATMPLTYGASHYANLDMTVAGLITATIVAAAMAVRRAERGEAYRAMVVLAYGLAGLAFLAKGLIGLVLPGAVLFVWLVGRWRLDLLWRLCSLPGLAMLLAVALPWMLLMQSRFPGFFDYYIVYQHFERFLQSSFNNARPVWFYPPVLLGLTLPWSWLLWRCARPSWWRSREDQALHGLMASWLLVIVGFFSLPTSKLIGYVLPALPPLAFLVASVWLWPGKQASVSASATRRAWQWRALLGGAAGICLVAAVAMVAAPQPSQKVLAAHLAERYAPEHDIVMLDRYRQDVPFYLRISKPMQVVLAWDDPAIARVDNWRRELLEAGQFDPALAARVLLRPVDIAERVASVREAGWWVIGAPDSVQRYPWLAAAEQVYAERAVVLWWLAPDVTVPVAEGGRGMPSNGPAGK